jgi:twitching motility protein PilU
MVDYRNENSLRPHHHHRGPGGVRAPAQELHRHAARTRHRHRRLGAALKNTLRQAPDVILMGEIRDRETMEHAVAFAETGHLCMATLHANSANQALDRIINFFPEERREQLLMDLSLNLKGLVSQRLLPRERRAAGALRRWRSCSTRRWSST